MAAGPKAVPLERVKALFFKSAQLLEQGDAAGAKKGLAKVVKQLPDSAMAWYNLGLSHQHLEEHHKAITAYKKTVRFQSDFIDGWVNLGLSHKSMGQTDEAERAGRSALAIDENHPRALNLIGTLEAEQGRYEEAKTCFERALASQPGYIDARFNLANLHLENGKRELALDVATPLIQQGSEKKEYRQLYAQTLIDLEDRQRAAPFVLELEKQYPDDVDIQKLGLSYRELIRDHFGAIEIAQKLLEEQPQDATVWDSLGGAYFQLDSIDKAKSCYQKAIELDSTRAQYENNLGLTFSSTGDKQNAEYHYRRAIEMSPEYSEVYRNIVAMKRFRSMDDPDVAAIKELWNKDDLDDSNRTKLAFALGKVYDDLGMYDEAFETYRLGNDLKFKDTKIELDKFFAHIDRIPIVFDRPPVNVVRQETRIKPIFILGMPRSGTTLVEQIISRHPDVYGCGELPCIERSITRMEKKADPQRIYPDDFWDICKDVFAAEVTEYVDWVERLHDIKTPFVTDKMPFNFVHIWLIKVMFPDAPIVHCRRHPLDVITSNYFQLYATDISFVYNLEKLANYYIRYYRLMEHWNHVFGSQITTIQYEALVQDPEGQTRSLIGAIGLPWDDACLDQKRSSTAVRTASIWQVRQGIYTRSRERWRSYEKYLQPAADILVREKILDESLAYVDG